MAAAAAAAAWFWFLVFLSILTNPATAHLGSGGNGFISVIASKTGLDFVKDLLIEEAVNSLTPLELPNIEKSVKIPFIGLVDVVLSNITLTHINVSSSLIHPGSTGVVIDASGANASVSTSWRYSYSTWLVPVDISDEGTAHIQVEGMEIGITLAMKDAGGSLKLTALECGSYIKNILITLDGGASWFYQGLIDAFEDLIRSTVEKSITKKITEGITKLDYLLQTIPKEIKVNDVLSLNATFMDDPLLGNTFIEFDIDGLFTATPEVEFSNFYKSSNQTTICSGSSKMFGISIGQAVFNSASTIYFNAGLMHLTVDKVPNQALLNTAAWKYIIPQLYKKYPNDDMKVNISLTSPPSITVTSKNIGTTIYSDMTIDVLDKGETIPVACISVAVSASAVMEISGNNLAGQAELESFSLWLKWSKVGNFHVYLIQHAIQALLNTVFMPYINLQLQKGYPLPNIHGFTIQNASIVSTDSAILVCSDVFYISSLRTRALGGGILHRAGMNNGNFMNIK